MHAKIPSELRRLEYANDVRVILAVESGSRAWGFHSTNSDYDVRHIYLGQPGRYVSAFPVRDVIEGPADGVLDFSGWDLRKALQLLWKSNPCLFEWLQSPIVYDETSEGTQFRKLAAGYFQPVAAMHHYLAMCRHNYREHMRNGAAPSVRLKKYLYITRPLLCCRWIARNPLAGPPPMSMLDLIAADPGLDSSVVKCLHSLIEAKTAGGELDEGAAMPALNRFIDCELLRLPEVIKTMPRVVVEPGPLDAFLRLAVL
jgi:predicted nucleotidyltransferase